MNTQSLLDQYFEVAFSAPEGVKRLRELILNLAMRGLLVPQDPTAQPARELLREIEAEKERLIRAGKIKKPSKLAEILPEEIPYELPETWEWVMLGNCMLKITDGTHRSPVNTERGDFLYISARNIKDDGVFLKNATYVTKEIHEEIYARCNPEPGDILYIKDGATTGVVTINNLEEPFSMLSSVALLKQPRQLDNRYLLFALRSPFFYQEMRLGMTGVAITRVTLKKLNESIIPLPPLEEQKRIVEKVDRLMEQCDRLEQLHREREQKRIIVHAAASHQLLNAKGDRELQTAWEFLRDRFGDLYAVKENISELRKAILQLAIMGKLVPQDPNDPPVSELLKEIEAERQQLVQGRKTKTEHCSINIKPHETPFDLPKGWKWVRLVDLVDIGTGSTPSKGNPKYYGGTIPWYTSAATNNIVAEKPSTFITEKALEETNCKIFPAGSLIIALYGQGKTRGQVSEIPLAGATNQAIAAMVFLESSKKVKRYIKYYFLKIYDEIRTLAEGGAQPNLNVGKIKATLIPLPPLPEQHRIVEKVDQLMELCDRLESKIDQQTQTQTRLLNTLMAELN